MGIAYNGREISEIMVSGRRMESGYINGRKVFPSGYQPKSNSAQFIVKITEDHHSTHIRIQGKQGYKIDWGDGTRSSSDDVFYDTKFDHTYKNEGFYTIFLEAYLEEIDFYNYQKSDETGVASFEKTLYRIEYMNFPTLKSLDVGAGGSFRSIESLVSIGELYLASCKSITNGFKVCQNLEKVDYIYAPEATSGANTFWRCFSLKEVPHMYIPKCRDYREMFGECTSLSSTININFNVNDTDATSMFEECTSLISILNINCTRGAKLTKMFKGCTSLRNISGLNVMYAYFTDFMFEDCKLLEFSPNDFHRDITMLMCGSAKSMFKNCEQLTLIGNVNIVGLNNKNCEILESDLNYYVDYSYYYYFTSCDKMFENCMNIKEIGTINIKNLRYVRNLFEGKSLLKSVGSITFNNVWYANSFFENCTGLEFVQSIVCSKTNGASDITAFLKGCTSLQGVGNLSIFNCTSISELFFNCKTLTVLPIIRINNPDVSSSFYGCSSLQTIVFEGVIKPSRNTFGNCSSLKTIIAETICISPFGTDSVEALSAQKVVDLLNLDWDCGFIKNGNASSLVNVLEVGERGIGKVYQGVGFLSDVQVTIANSKGWNVYYFWFNDSIGPVYMEDSRNFPKGG